MDIGKMFINGEWVPADSGRTRDIFDPATGEKTASVAEGGAEEARRAVDAAAESFKTWRKSNNFQRAALLSKTADLLEAAAEEIADVECRSTGKLLRNTRGDVAGVCNVFRYYAGIVGTPSAETFNCSEDVLTMNIREPIGVCGIISPWNSPVSIASKAIAPALAASNTIVVKPASITPLGTIKMFECMEKAGFPKGVVNLVLGSGSIVGQELGENMKIGKVSLTGGTETGRELIRASASNIKKLSLELGGKSPIIVFEDADLDIAANNIIYALYNNSGQVCVAGSRALIHEKIYAEFTEELVRRVKKIKVGAGAEADAQMGPVVSSDQLEKILRYIEIGKQEGARLAVGGNRMTEGRFAKGYFIEPTLFLDCVSDMRIVQEEIFGPVLTVGKFASEEDAWRLANDTIYGLGAAVFTRDVGRTQRFMREVKASCLWVNTYYASAGFDAPISCLKQSGYSTLMGVACVESYMDVKQVSMRHIPVKFPLFE
jgi:betaine-aldehyde dehydrogenase